MVARPAAVVVRIYREAERGLADIFTVHLDDAPGWDACDADCLHGGGLSNLWLDSRVSCGLRGASSEGGCQKEQKGSHFARTYHSERDKGCPTPKKISRIFFECHFLHGTV